MQISSNTANKLPGLKRLDWQQLPEEKAVDRVELSSTPAPEFKMRGMIAPGDIRHQVRDEAAELIAPIKVEIPGGKFVPQYAPTVVGTRQVFDPAGDCNGNFMSSKFQVNNNCYNYACDVATNSFAQPGRKHGLLLGEGWTPEDVATGAKADGLIEISRQPMTNDQMQEKAKELPPGHFVALLMSAPDSNAQWPGDYHWVRQDENGSWSQKDGTDQVTNFDYAGHPILDPSAANWTVNEGPMSSKDNRDVVINYKFFSIMYVPDGKIDII
ncbi:MAG: hypothetical protein U0931_33900 [Vulcanimicrobiota bacterium]